MAEWETSLDFGKPRWETFAFSESVTNPELNGRRVAEAASERNVDPFGLILDVALDEPGLAMLDLYRQGRLKLDELITTRYTLGDVNQGYQDMRDGRNIRGVIVFD
jgi:hypothetical protein